MTRTRGKHATSDLLAHLGAGLLPAPHTELKRQLETQLPNQPESDLRVTRKDTHTMDALWELWDVPEDDLHRSDECEDEDTPDYCPCCLHFPCCCQSVIDQGAS